MKRFPFLLFFLVLGMFNLVQGAASIHSITLTSASLLQCGGNVIEARYTPVGVDASGNPVDSFNAVQYFVTSNGNTSAPSESFKSGSSHTFYLSVGSDPMTYAEVYLVSSENPAVRSNTIRIMCDGSVQDTGGAVNADGEKGPDDRLNAAKGDLINVLYLRPDASGESEIAVYTLDADSNGVFEGVFPNELFAPYIGNPPAENTYLAELDRSKLYALASGEFQVVISDPVEVKSYNVIFSVSE